MRAMAVVAVLFGGAWWSWPILASRDGTRPGGVLIVDDGYLSVHERAFGDRLRGDGRVVEWLAAADWCAAGAALRQRSTQTPAPPDRDVVILSMASPGACDDSVRAATTAAVFAGAEDVVIVPQEALQDSDLATAFDNLAADVMVARTERLLGSPATTEMPCEWWDGCETTVSVRGPDGSLTASGAGRVSRLVVELLR